MPSVELSSVSFHRGGPQKQPAPGGQGNAVLFAEKHGGGGAGGGGGGVGGGGTPQPQLRFWPRPESQIARDCTPVLSFFGPHTNTARHPSAALHERGVHTVDIRHQDDASLLL